MHLQRWDLFCRVIDNYGDVGVSWRLAADLASRGHAVRLFIDDAQPLQWMAPGGAPGVQVLAFDAPADAADVVVETFGCDPPPAYVQRMAERAVPPVWINLEYLSAEAYVERSHGLPSPQRNGLTKWFFYPGFTPRTGGLLREPGLAAAQAAFDRDAWLGTLGIERRAGERVVSLFAYPQAPFAGLLQRLDTEPTLVLLCAGASQAAALAQAPCAARTLRMQALPWLSQPDFDRLLWSADLNLMRGEDSIVRAMWAGVPFVWHIYPQHDEAHVTKLDALLDRMTAATGDDATGRQMRALWQAWNGLATWPDEWPASRPWRAFCHAWRQQLQARPDLVSQLVSFCDEKAAAG
ncbi:elongation factor P maturation arginine rhamnosyltransferase EarP [Aquincola tertiaricarbonis]|uniref:elongation factor P maturation arginine rhamnosyltransferase EarP n=1 Tax=Aquincola tertiaricarbonis TaxID=391953 RepID=UPI000615013D|nr:elongation factor P maturation arginine rhamnosyltransferase EarP [Aquincola tertiaricarbonis]